MLLLCLTEFEKVFLKNHAETHSTILIKISNGTILSLPERHTAAVSRVIPIMYDTYHYNE